MSHLIRTWRHGRQILHEQGGQALVEFALVLPLILLVVFGVLKMGIAATSWSDETHLASEAARYAVVNKCPACGAATINDWILTQADTGDLKNNGTVTITFTDTTPPNHCAGNAVQVTISYPYTLLDMPLLPKFTHQITATSTQRIEKSWGDATTGLYNSATDDYTATGNLGGACPP
jgi:hypothetical protein